MVRGSDTPILTEIPCTLSRAQGFLLCAAFGDADELGGY